VYFFIVLHYLLVVFITHPTAAAPASPAPIATPQLLIFPGLHSGVLAAAIMASDSIPSASKQKGQFPIGNFYGTFYCSQRRDKYKNK
jgi:hypothetical protein